MGSTSLHRRLLSKHERERHQCFFTMHYNQDKSIALLFKYNELNRLTTYSISADNASRSHCRYDQETHRTTLHAYSFLPVQITQTRINSPLVLQKQLVFSPSSSYVDTS
eukprot:TRINITY_DN23531_c0_g1_i1.p1 TRINITY_DN23531_c0_g1~~TRINITY_DN23531_c0_g1_i1.p1  ORF type:complete len:109 (-),score=2.32 TRINITY_DN23531_c0_g1_i1:144-470(-)